MRETYDLNFLREKGFFEKEQALKEKLPSKEQITFVFDPDNRIAYFEDIKREKMGEVVKHLKEGFNFDYYWFWEEGRLVVFRTFGENKQFIFNIERERGKTEFLKSKIKKLREFSIDNPNILFDVKDVVDHFYKRLWLIRIKLAKTIQDDISDKEKILSSQRLIDRLIFTYFLGEKGIIKGKDKRGREVLTDVKELFKYLLETSKDFHKLLNKIFFEFLNSKVKNEMQIPEREEFSLIIPYLNGGLFREKMLKTKTGNPVGESNLHFEGFDWRELIKELNEYNWIIEEFVAKEDEDTIGNLTPEILGHIYEKFVITLSELGEINFDELSMTSKGELKKGRKKVGGYYTPEDIVKYISENTLFPYVQNKIGLNKKFDSFEEFYNEFWDNTKFLKEFGNHLSKITILDPAVGSGHFLMSAAELIYDWRKKCGTEMDDYSLRKTIILENLYGVDIMGGAVEICKLRLWLWLTASLSPDSKPEALPNIEFNIREGNSLIGFAQDRKLGQSFLITHNVKDELKEYMENIKQFKKGQKDVGKQKIRLDEQNSLLREKFDKWYSSFYIRTGKRRFLPRDLERLKIFHWIMEFPNIFNPERGESGFDVVIGNPPWGIGVLKREEKQILTNYTTSGSNEISAYFLERELNLLKEKGTFGNIIANSIAVNEQLTQSRNLIRESLIEPKVAFIGTRPSRIFHDVEKRVCLILGIKDTSQTSPIYSSKNIRFRKENRPNLLKTLNFESTKGLRLGSKIGVIKNNELTVMPKIGNKNTKNILIKLKKISIEDRTIEEIISPSMFSLEFRNTGGYWLHALRKFPYKSTMVKSISFEKEIERDFVLLIISSSLFYLFWTVYGDNRHLYIGFIKRFPIPSKNKLLENEEQIRELSNKANDALLGCFDKYVGRMGQFDTGKCKHLIDEVDDFLGELYGLSSEQVKYIQSYDNHIRK